MIIIEGLWKSNIDSTLNGKIILKINAEKLHSQMTGTAKMINYNNRQCLNYIEEFPVEIMYERNFNLIVDGKQNVIDRLFIRQSILRCDVYYTFQLTSYNSQLWYGSYTSIYPNDMGELIDFQIIINCDTSNQLSGINIFNYEFLNDQQPCQKKRKLENQSIHASYID